MDRQKALHVIKSNWPDGRFMLQEALRTLIPEFNESGDEKIRKQGYFIVDKKTMDEIIKLFKYLNYWVCGANDEIINKLKHLKPTTNNVKPKFKVGDWITNGIDFTFQVISIEDNYYLRSDDYFIDIETADKTFRLWTIQDAMDGDVLALNGEVFIYAHRKQLYSIAIAHCFVDNDGGFYFDGEFGYTEKSNLIHPATKTQRDLLFTKMKEAGYEWDAEKKELKKIEQKPKIYDSMDDLIADALIEEIENSELDDRGKHNRIIWIKSHRKKPTWSEEDEKMLNHLIDVLYGTPSARFIPIKREIMIPWLESIKDRMKGE